MSICKLFQHHHQRATQKAQRRSKKTELTNL